jgi:hypothetical protein
MAARLLILVTLATVVAGCGAGGGGDGGGGGRARDDQEAFARRAQAFPKTLTSPLPPYSVRYPSALKRINGAKPPAPVVLRRASDGATCTITAAGPLPDVARPSALEDYLTSPPGGPSPTPPAAVRDEEAADDADGASLVRRLPGGRTVVFEGLVQTAGRGVSFLCEAPRAAEKDFDRLVFRPMLASVRLRPDSGLERVQRSFLVIPGVTRASLLRRGPRPLVTGVVEFSPNLRTRGALRQAMARALLTASDNLPTDRVQLTGLGRDDLPVRGVVHPGPPRQPGGRPQPGAGELSVGAARRRFLPPDGLRGLAGAPADDSTASP